MAANSFSTLLPADLIESYWNYRYGTSCPYETDRADVVYEDPNNPVQNKRYIAKKMFIYSFSINYLLTYSRCFIIYSSLCGRPSRKRFHQARPKSSSLLSPYRQARPMKVAQCDIFNVRMRQLENIVEKKIVKKDNYDELYDRLRVRSHNKLADQKMKEIAAETNDGLIDRWPEAYQRPSSSRNGRAWYKPLASKRILSPQNKHPTTKNVEGYRILEEMYQGMLDVDSRSKFYDDNATVNVHNDNEIDNIIKIRRALLLAQLNGVPEPYLPKVEEEKVTPTRPSKSRPKTSVPRSTAYSIKGSDDTRHAQLLRLINSEHPSLHLVPITRTGTNVETGSVLPARLRQSVVEERSKVADSSEEAYQSSQVSQDFHKNIPENNLPAVAADAADDSLTHPLTHSPTHSLTYDVIGIDEDNTRSDQTPKIKFRIPSELKESPAESTSGSAPFRPTNEALLNSILKKKSNLKAVTTIEKGVELKQSDGKVVSVVNKEELARERAAKYAEFLGFLQTNSIEIHENTDIKLNKLLGRGKFAAVHEGDVASKHLPSPVAIKCVQIPQNEEAVATTANYSQTVPVVCIEEYRREILALTALKGHDNIVQFFGVSTNPLRIVLEYCSQGNLHDYLDVNDWRLKPKSRTGILLGISSGLHHMHTNGFVHRDIKLFNILMERGVGGVVVPKISDFGTAVSIKERVANGLSECLTDQCGTLGYTAPEIYRYPCAYSYAVDVFSFAIVAWEIFAGRSKNPLLNYDLDTLVPKLEEGFRPQFDTNHPACIKELITAAWHGDETRRPSMTTLYTILTDLCNDHAHFTKHLYDPTFMLEKLFPVSTCAPDEDDDAIHQSRYTVARDSPKIVAKKHSDFEAMRKRLSMSSTLVY